MKGLFITFEGSEGCGKSTQSKLLYQHLRRKGLDVVYLREPGGTKASEKIRKILLDPKNDIVPETEMLLYMAARAELVKNIIRPSLLKGKTVICDRFLDSTLVYQGFALGVDLSLIKLIGKFATYGIEPDLTILMDLPVEAGLKNRRVKDRIENRSLRYHCKVREGYLALAKKDRKRIKVVKVQKFKPQTQEEIKKTVENFLKEVNKGKINYKQFNL